MNYEPYSYAMAPKQTEWTQTGDPKIGCVQHDCDNCKKNWDLMLDHIKENTKLRGEVEALKEILRTNNDQLEIRMSMGDFHVKRCMTNQEMQYGTHVYYAVSRHAANMYDELHAARSK